tara:strand:- start:425 stop:1339 length:915 start_codon:yes stop_codon:yes gene_type:complete
MKHIKGSFAKDITRMAVTDLYRQFISDKKQVYVQSLPGTSWQFERDVIASSWHMGYGKFKIECFEKNKSIFSDQEGLAYAIAKETSNPNRHVGWWDKEVWGDFLAYRYGEFESCIPDDFQEHHYFAWKDYCGLPTQKIINDVWFDYESDIVESTSSFPPKSVFVFTFSTSWRRSENIPEKLKALAKKHGEAEAICSYFSSMAKEYGYKLLFKCEYRSSRTPMVIFALTNDKKLRSPKIIDLYADKLTEGRKRMTNKLNDLAPEIKEQVYTCLKDNVEDGVILSKYGISKKRLGSYKAHITMGNR